MKSESELEPESVSGNGNKLNSSQMIITFCGYSLANILSGHNERNAEYEKKFLLLLFSDLGCAQGSAACAKYDNPAHVEDYGKPMTELQINSDNELYLNYSTTDKPAECGSNPVTTITFKCPKRGMVRVSSGVNRRIL